MSDRTEEIAEQTAVFLHNADVSLAEMPEIIAAALRAYAEEARREEQDALKQWAKDRCGHCQIAAEDFVADRAAAIRARGEETG